MFASTSGLSIAGFSPLPASPPVQVTTMTSCPSATYLAIVAAPLLDSSSGWACTAIKRSFSAMTSVNPLDRLAHTRLVFRTHPVGLIVPTNQDDVGRRGVTIAGRALPKGRYG